VAEAARGARDEGHAAAEGTIRHAPPIGMTEGRRQEAGERGRTGSQSDPALEQFIKVMFMCLTVASTAGELSMTARRTIGLGLAMAVALAGCAKKGHEIQASYVPSAQYDAMDYDRIGEELNRVAAEVNRVTGEQDDAAQRDAVVMGVGLILFWPALFILAAGDEAEELSRLKGEYEALDRVRSEKACAAVS